jgi:CRP/FNR family transcriptional regulator, nitrogen fixation regulation protein
MKTSNNSMAAGPTRRTYQANAPATPLQKLHTLAMVSTHHRGQEICGQGDPAESWFCVVSGVARRYIVRLDGRRQIVDLLLPGDYFGFTTDPTWDFGVEAVNDGTVIASYSRRRVESLADSDPDVARQIREAAFDALSRLQCQLLIVGRITAPEKVGSFILEMASRLPHGRGNSIALPVTRYDIADYLAVSVETVSRSLTDLKHRGVIRMSGARTVEILNQEALKESETLVRLSTCRGTPYRQAEHTGDACEV